MNYLDVAYAMNKAAAEVQAPKPGILDAAMNTNTAKALKPRIANAFNKAVGAVNRVSSAAADFSAKVPQEQKNIDSAVNQYSSKVRQLGGRANRIAMAFGDADLGRRLENYAHKGADWLHAAGGAATRTLDRANVAAKELSRPLEIRPTREQLQEEMNRVRANAPGEARRAFFQALPGEIARRAVFFPALHGAAVARPGVTARNAFSKWLLGR